MVAPLVIAAGVSAVASIAGGIMSSNAASAEAQRAQQYASYNAEAQLSWGATQSRLTLMSAMYNAGMAQKSAQFNVSQNNEWISYNTETAWAVQSYNDLLFDDQIGQVYEASDLSREQLALDYIKARGETVNKQAASGTVIGDGSNKDVVIQMTAEEALFDLVLSRNADTQANALLNAKAKGRWETGMAVKKMQYEGMLANKATLFNAQMGANAALVNGMMSAMNIQGTASNQATSILAGGAQTASNQNAQADMYMTSGLLNGAGSAASAYAQYDGGNGTPPRISNPNPKIKHDVPVDKPFSLLNG